MSEGRTFDWRKSPDTVKDERYALRRAVPAPVPRRSKDWRASPIRIDQRREGACVGFGWTNELMARPGVVRIPDPNAFASQVYAIARKIDEFPGEADDGTSVNAGAQVMRRSGYIADYYWPQTVDEVLDALIAKGPVVIGIPWLSGMYDTRPSGLVELAGRVVGGHCVLLSGYYTKLRLRGEPVLEDIAKWRNSWGPGYGRTGNGYVRVADLERLLAHGEACVAVGRYAGPARGFGYDAP